MMSKKAHGLGFARRQVDQYQRRMDARDLSQLGQLDRNSQLSHSRVDGADSSEVAARNERGSPQWCDGQPEQIVISENTF